MQKKVLKLLNGQLLPSMMYIALGICLILFPVQTVQILCKVVFGLMMIGAGAFHLWTYLAKKREATVLDLFSGVTVLALGVFLFSNPQIVVKILTLVLGSFLIVDSVWTVQLGCRMKKYHRSEWIFLVLISVGFAGLGVMILYNPFHEIRMAFVLAGWTFLVNGGMDLLFMFLQRNFYKKVESGQYTITSESEQITSEKPDKSESLNIRKFSRKKAREKEVQDNRKEMKEVPENRTEQEESDLLLPENLHEEAASEGVTEQTETQITETEELLEEWKD